MAENSDHLRKLVAEVAAAYLSNSHVSPNEIPGLVAQISSSLSAVGSLSPVPSQDEAPSPAKLTRSEMAKSITPDALISFEDGKRYRTLRRHLAARGLTPAQYVAKWGLPRDYPMVAPSYSAARRALAMDRGLGVKRSEAPAAPPAADTFEEDQYTPQAADPVEPEAAVEAAAPEAEAGKPAAEPKARRAKAGAASQPKPRGRPKKATAPSKAPTAASAADD